MQWREEREELSDREAPSSPAADNAGPRPPPGVVFLTVLCLCTFVRTGLNNNRRIGS